MFKKNQIMRRYGKFAIENECLPMYADVNVRFKGEKTYMPVIIKLSLDIGDDDENVFFNVDGLRGLLALVECPKEDFWVSKFNGFTNEIF